MTFKKHQWQRRISHEFNKPAKEVIISYATDGYSKRLTAGALEINTQTLRNYANREGIKFPERNELREECKPKPSKGNNPLGYWARYK